jgi:Alpha-amylase/alpha-mannosidase
MDLVLWWHMHQPDYRDLNGEFMLPWVYLHAIKDYIDMPLNIMANQGMKASINITPVLIDEWQDYNYLLKKALNEIDAVKAVQIIPDPFLRPLLLQKLDDKTKSWMIVHYKWANYERMVKRFEHYKTLFDITSSAFNVFYLNDSYYFDLCVWFHLAWCGEWMKRYDPVINYFFKKGHNFTIDDRRLLLKRLAGWMNYGISLYGFPAVKGEKNPTLPPKYPNFIEKDKLNELNKKRAGEYSVTLSPNYHPIIPLLIDIHGGAISAQMTDINYEPVNTPEYPEGLDSAKKHLDILNDYWAESGKDIKALWPSEGALSSQSLDLFNEYGVDICASGEELLSMSMGIDIHKPASTYGRNVVPLYKVYKWKNTNLKIIFRDSGLSDLIGFTYANWRGDDAANNLAGKLNSIDDFDKEAVVAIILDGENAWEYYHENGFYFLNDLYSLISSSIKINPLFIDDIYKNYDADNCIRLDYIYPGSWVNGNLGMWVGEEQKNKAWVLLCNAKEEFLNWVNGLMDNEENRNNKIIKKRINSALRLLMAAEGSDWFWWLGKDSPLFSQYSMEKIFRNFLKNLYITMDKPVPNNLFRSLASTEKTIAEMGGAMQRGHK